MNKKEFELLLKRLGISFNEGIQNDNDKKKYPRIVFWEFAWDDISASDEVYKTNVTYQVSFFSKEPRDSKLLELKKSLNQKSIRPTINHEYIQEEKYFHSYFAIDIVEDLSNV